MVEIRYYVSESGAEPFAEWFTALEAGTAARIARGLARMEQGNFSNAKSVGGGVLEYKLDFGPRVPSLFWARWDTIVILLTGGTKRRQQRDIEAAQAYWRDYRSSKRTRN